MPTELPELTRRQDRALVCALLLAIVLGLVRYIRKSGGLVMPPLSKPPMSSLTVRIPPDCRWGLN
jgi:hypothetical protein